jgi:succinoglycan biosynthesis transport protein ExoP
MQQHSSIPALLRVLRRRTAVVILCFALVPAAAFAFSISQQTKYTASAKLLFRDPGFDQKLFGSQVFQPSADPAREAATNLQLVSLDVVAKRTGKRVPRAGSVKEHVSVQAEGQSNVVTVSATYPDRRLAARVANTFAQQYIALRQEADRAKIAQAQALVNRQLRGLSSAGQSAQERTLRDRLDVLSSLQTGNAELAEGASVPSNPSSPKIVRNTVLGAFLGLLLGVGVALLLERLDRRLRDPRELEEIFERPILAAVPESRTLSRSGLVHEVLPSTEGEAFRMLRANLRYFNIDRGVESVLVTSPAPGDGKSTVAWNLAATAAGSGGRVLLIEADLRHPALAKGLGLQGAAGLSTILSGEAALEDVVQEVPIQGDRTGGVRTVDVLLAGPLPPNPADLLESARMRDVIAAAERTYDLFVIDTPPASVVSDAIPLLSQVGGVIVVARLAKTTRDAAAHLGTQLRNLDARVLGVVVNGVGSDSDTYGYGYGYAAKYEAAVAHSSTPETTTAGRDAYSDAGERTGSR